MDALGSLSVLVAATVALFIVFAYWLNNKYKYFERRGLPGPKPLPLVGNLYEIMFKELGNVQKEWVKKYGRVVGTYFGTEPRVLIADAEILHRICIKDFDVFPNHAAHPLLNDYQRNFLVFLKDDQWRRVRALMSPTFTSRKIRRMFRWLDGCANDLIKCFSEQLKPDGASKSAIVNCKDVYSLFTLDAIATCCYGLKLERDSSTTSIEGAASRNEFARMGLRIFRPRVFRFILGAILPSSLLIALGFRVMSTNDITPLTKVVQRLIDARRKSTKKFDDYLQLLVDTNLDADLELDKMDSEENHHAGLSHESLKEDQKRLVDKISRESGQKVTLTDLEILSNAAFLLIVGLETTGTLLAHCTYSLAFHQDIQERLYEEIKAIASYNEDKTSFIFDYDALTSCRYLDAVISETLRCLPAISLFDRTAARDYHIEEYNYTVKEGHKLTLGFYAILHDPEYWPEPEKFDPERFMPGNREKIVPGSYCPFGMGPRHCLGMRFSLTESKLAIAKFLMNFKALPAPNTTFPAKFARGLFLNVLVNPRVKIVPRC